MLLSEEFLNIGEYGAAGMYEEPDRSLFYRKALGIRRFYENCKLAEYHGEYLYPSVTPQERKAEWIPCSERLPEEDKEVLISYRYKEGEGDTSNVSVDITTYGQMYFGGNKVGNDKHWRAPFEYFESNYEVIAWMPLPEPYKAESEDE